MRQVTLDEAIIHLSDLIEASVRSENVFITKDHGTRRFGSAKGLVVMIEDFDDELRDFKEYIKQKAGLIK